MSVRSLNVRWATKFGYNTPVGETVCSCSPLPDRAVPVTGCPLLIGIVLPCAEARCL